MVDLTPQQLEIWKPVVGYEKLYEVSNRGRVKSLNRLKTVRVSLSNVSKITRVYGGKILKLSNNKLGYKKVTLSKNNVVVTKLVHRLVAEAFLENPKNKKCVNHLDKNPQNNFVNNLEWCTYKENERHSWKNGKKRVRGDKNSFAKLSDQEAVQIMWLLKNVSGIIQTDLAEVFNVSLQTVNAIKKGRRWSHLAI